MVTPELRVQSSFKNLCKRNLFIGASLRKSTGSVVLTIKRSKHDKYVDDLCSKLKGEYDHVLRHVPIYAPRRSRRKILLAEVDVSEIAMAHALVLQIRDKPNDF